MRFARCASVEKPYIHYLQKNTTPQHWSGNYLMFNKLHFQTESRISCKERLHTPPRTVTRISKELHQIRAITSDERVDQRWTLLLTRLLRHWLGGKCLPGLPDEAALLLSG